MSLHCMSCRLLDNISHRFAIRFKITLQSNIRAFEFITQQNHLHSNHRTLHHSGHNEIGCAVTILNTKSKAGSSQEESFEAFLPQHVSSFAVGRSRFAVHGFSGAHTIEATCTLDFTLLALSSSLIFPHTLGKCWVPLSHLLRSPHHNCHNAKLSPPCRLKTDYAVSTAMYVRCRLLPLKSLSSCLSLPTLTHVR